MTPLRAALRAATQAGHTKLETTMALDPAGLTRDRYGRALQVLHAVRAGWEPALAAFLPGAHGPHLAWLEADLRVLGLPSLPPAEPPPHGSEAEAWGLSYVLEGSALGGQVLLRALVPLGLTPEHGARYFAGHGKQTGTYWAAFLARLEEQAGPLTTPSITRAAQSAFAALDRVAQQHLMDP